MIMGVIALEGVVDHGQIHLKNNIRLPEKTRVYVVIPDIQIEQASHLVSPRLAHREEAAGFRMEVIEESSDARL